jgi:CRP-like cAMP-binding protein
MSTQAEEIAAEMMKNSFARQRDFLGWLLSRYMKGLTSHPEDRHQIINSGVPLKLKHPTDAKKNAVSRASLSRTVSRLESRGLIIRVGEARTHSLKFTKLGFEVAKLLARSGQK